MRQAIAMDGCSAFRPRRGRGSLAETFEWLEIELNNVVAKAQPNTYVARIFVTHLARATHARDR